MLPSFMIRLGSARFHKVSEQSVMGSTQSILVDKESGYLSGASDPRRVDAATFIVSNKVTPA